MRQRITTTAKALVLGSLAAGLIIAAPAARAADEFVIEADGDIGMGTAMPGAQLHVFGTTGMTNLLVQDMSATAGSRNLFAIENNGSVAFDFENTATSSTWRILNIGNPPKIIMTELGNPGPELTLDQNGDLTVLGDINSGGTTVVPDYVFEPDYKLMPLKELGTFIEEKKHLPNIPSKAEVEAKGSVNITILQMKLLEKVEELTLYTLQQQKTLQTQEDTITALKARLAALEQTEETKAD